IRALNLVKLESEAKELALFSIIGRNLDFSEEIKPNNNSSPKTILLPLPKTENKQSDLKLEQAKVKKGQLPDWKPNVD
ncbi:MAG: hypothetical protein J0L55_17590, partial [Caulobacterales bacterium]|nr:hypothetical protein [Caulobacterales bacterium]